LSGVDPAGRALRGSSVAGAAAARGAQGAARGPSTQWLARAVFGVLVVACFVAFGVTQRLKHTPTAVQNFEQTKAFYPTRVAAAGCHGRVPKSQILANDRVEYVSFKPAQTDAVTVAIVNAAGGEEATLVRNLPVARYKQLSLCWNGQRGPRQRGGLAPPGEYRLRVSLRSRSLPVYSPEGFALRPAGR
jgi:hypothetical protein